jgi:hypothetical protein
MHTPLAHCKNVAHMPHALTHVASIHARMPYAHRKHAIMAQAHASCTYATSHTAQSRMDIARKVLARCIYGVCMSYIRCMHTTRMLHARRKNAENSLPARHMQGACMPHKCRTHATSHVTHVPHACDTPRAHAMHANSRHAIDMAHVCLTHVGRIPDIFHTQAAHFPHATFMYTDILHALKPQACATHILCAHTMCTCPTLHTCFTHTAPTNTT